jgi:hypothetical protein
VLETGSASQQAVVDCRSKVVMSYLGKVERSY